MTLEEVADALRGNRHPLAEQLLTEEWSRRGPTELFYQLIKSGLVTVMKLLQELKLCSEWDIFRYSCNAMNELKVKNVTVSGEMELYLLYVLSSYGFLNLCGDPDCSKPPNYWQNSISKVQEYCAKLRQRKKCYDYLDINDEVIFLLQMIHNHLYFIKDHELIKPMPLKEMIFCLAIFLQVCRGASDSDIFATIINKRNILQYLRAVSFRLTAVKEKSNKKPKQAHIIKKLLKTYRKAKQMHSVYKVIQSAKVCDELDPRNRMDAAEAIASMKRFTQILGESIKNTVDTPNFSAKLRGILPNMLTSAVSLNSKYRNKSTHGFSLSQLFLREEDQYFLYSKMFAYLHTVTNSFLILWIYILNDCMLHSYGIMRRCRTVEDMQAFVRYAGSSRILNIHQKASQDVMKYLRKLQGWSERTSDGFSASEYIEKIKLVESLQKLTVPTFATPIQIAVFGNAPIEAIHRLLNFKFTVGSSKDQFYNISYDWKELTKLTVENPEYSGISAQFLIHHNSDESEQDRYRERSQSIFNCFTDNSHLDFETLNKLKDKLHEALSQGYYQNIFALDCKAQAISDVLKSALVGSKKSKESKQQIREFKQRNLEFKQKLEAMRKEDKQELTGVFVKVVQNIKRAFAQCRCDTIENFIKNINKIPLKTKLAIEYWQLQALEILEASDYFGDNFYLLTKAIPVIWGKSYRNYLAHDFMSYDLLTGSSSVKTLVNGFVLAEHSEKLNIFVKCSKFEPVGLTEVEHEGFQWLAGQKDLLRAILARDHLLITSSVQNEADIYGKYLRPMGFCAQLKYYSIPEILAHEGLDVNEFKNSMKEKLLTTTGLVRRNKLATELNMRRFDNLPIRQAISEFKKHQPQLVTPCIGAVLPHLHDTGKIDLMVELLQESAGPLAELLLIICTDCGRTAENYLDTILGLDTPFNFILIELGDSGLDRLISEANPASNDLLINVVGVNDIQTFQYIMRKCYNTTRSTLLESNLETALHRCSSFGHLEMVRTLLDIGLGQNDPDLLSEPLGIALQEHHTAVAQLLVDRGANPWAGEHLSLFIGIVEQNFKLIRQVIRKSFPEQSHKQVGRWSAEYGSERFMRFLLANGLDVWQCGEILSASLKNKRTGMFYLMKSLVFKQAENCCEHKELQTWMRIVNDLKILAHLLTDPGFVTVFVNKNLPSASDLLNQISNLLEQEKGYFATHFLLVDDNGSVEIDLQNISLNEELAKTVIKKCSSIQKRFLDIPTKLIQFRKEFTATAQHASASSNASVGIEIFSEQPIQEIQTDSSLFAADLNNHHSIDKLHNIIGSFLANTSLPNDAIVAMSIEIAHNKYKYIRIGSNSCIYERQAATNINLGVILNFPQKSNVLSAVPPNCPENNIQMLLHLGADPLCLDDEGQNAFFTGYEFSLSHYKLLYRHCRERNQIYLPDGTHIFNHRSNKGYSALQLAIGSNKYDLTEFLLQNGADPTVANPAARAGALGYAIMNRNVRITRLLLDHMPELINMPATDRGSTALETAVQINHDQLVRLLLDRGADPSIADCYGETALAVAADAHANDLLKLMLATIIGKRTGWYVFGVLPEILLKHGIRSFFRCLPILFRNMNSQV